MLLQWTRGSVQKRDTPLHCRAQHPELAMPPSATPTQRWGVRRTAVGSNRWKGRVQAKPCPFGTAQRAGIPHCPKEPCGQQVCCLAQPVPALRATPTGRGAGGESHSLISGKPPRPRLKQDRVCGLLVPPPPSMGHRCVCTTGTVRHKAEVHSKSQRAKLFSDMSSAPFAAAIKRADDAQLFTAPKVLCTTSFSWCKAAKEAARHLNKAPYRHTAEQVKRTSVCALTAPRSCEGRGMV